MVKHCHILLVSNPCSLVSLPPQTRWMKWQCWFHRTHRIPSRSTTETYCWGGILDDKLVLPDLQIPVQRYIYLQLVGCGTMEMIQHMLISFLFPTLCSLMSMQSNFSQIASEYISEDLKYQTFRGSKPQDQPSRAWASPWHDHKANSIFKIYCQTRVLSIHDGHMFLRMHQKRPISSEGAWPPPPPPPLVSEARLPNMHIRMEKKSGQMS